ncbi:sensor histidine kinase [Frisingicoccus sp.]|uniref:sensor histidine kinase n=1 Tax=Frisingicoccus sp. TaxID=1918627 RepID=UPI003AB2CF0C
MPFLHIICALSVAALILCLWKIHDLRRGAEELRTEFAARLSADTNVGIDISTSDKKMRALAADMDRQLKLLRREHLRYALGDSELKNAVAGISHDLRTPLTAICGYMDLLAREETSDDVREYLSIIDGRIQALKDLTEELFRYSVITTVDNYEIRENVSLKRTLEDGIAAYYGAFKKAGINPNIRLPETDVIRRLNSAALTRILSNIFSNAVKYSDGGFSVSLDAKGIFQFKNQASGLDEVQTGHLFDRFYTVNSGSHSTGLGLSIAKTLTEEMHGHIDATYHEGCLTITLSFLPD